MNTRSRTALQAMKPSSCKGDKISPPTPRMQEKAMVINGGKVEKSKPTCGSKSRRERKIALQQDVDKLKKTLRHEENVRRALERAFTRPLGALPRLPSYLPSCTLELLAEVAVLEEEVVKLEEQVVNFRQGLYKEAIHVSQRNSVEFPDLYPNNYPFQDQKQNSDLVDLKSSLVSPWMHLIVEPEAKTPFSNCLDGNKLLLKRSNSAHVASFDDRWGKENHSTTNPARNGKQFHSKKVQKIKSAMETQQEKRTLETCFDCPDPNKLSEDILKCLISIFARMWSSSGNSEVLMEFSDPYETSKKFGKSDIGPYKLLRSLDSTTFNSNFGRASSTFLLSRLRVLLLKLAVVDLAKLDHNQKLAFWINIYNSCMMNAYLDQGIPSNPHMVVDLMAKAIINVGGYSLSAMTIEHFILRLPCQSKSIEGVRSRGVLGLERPEPLVTFALACGSWSSPAVRVYTGGHVEKELEKAKRDYLRAAVAISRRLSATVAIPKLLDWYLLDFADGVDSLLQWVFSHLPDEDISDAKSPAPPPPPHVQVLPYHFTFRYLLGD